MDDDLPEDVGKPSAPTAMSSAPPKPAAKPIDPAEAQRLRDLQQQKEVELKEVLAKVTRRTRALQAALHATALARIATAGALGTALGGASLRTVADLPPLLLLLSLQVSDPRLAMLCQGLISRYRHVGRAARYGLPEPGGMSLRTVADLPLLLLLLILLQACDR
jgi:hypothetical protein